MISSTVDANLHGGDEGYWAHLTALIEPDSTIKVSGKEFQSTFNHSIAWISALFEFPIQTSPKKAWPVIFMVPLIHYGRS